MALRSIDLMIGDWVQVTDACTGKSIPCKITSIWENEYVALDGDIDATDLPTDLLAPIPITPKILKKNGFGYIENDGMELSHYYLGNRNSCRLGLHIGTNKKGDYWVNTNYNDIYGLKYIHELQNAFRLFKLEKDIVL